MDINAAAPVITRDEILIAAPVQTIWDIQTDVAAWPSCTEESWQGEPVSAQVETLQGALDASLRAWLENLKRTAEAQAA